jgi:hypothetical protein
VTTELAGPRAGDLVIWSLTGVGQRLESYVIFRQGPAGGLVHLVHIEGRHVWGRVFTEAKGRAEGRPVWLREGAQQPWCLIDEPNRWGD